MGWLGRSGLFLELSGYSGCFLIVMELLLDGGIGWGGVRHVCGTWSLLIDLDNMAGEERLHFRRLGEHCG